MRQTLVAAEVYDRLQRAMASDPEGFCDLYREYLSDARLTLSHLYLASDSRNSEELRAKAHYLKSSSLVLGISAIGELCAEIEDCGERAKFAAVPRKLGKLTELLDQVQSELEQKLGPRVIPAAA